MEPKQTKKPKANPANDSEGLCAFKYNRAQITTPVRMTAVIKGKNNVFPLE